MAHLSLALLGSFQADIDGKPAEGLNSDHLRALLAYLAVEGKRQHSRELVASLLWPERSDQEAFNALRSALFKVRAALGDHQENGSPGASADRPLPAPFLLVTRTHVQFNPASDHWLDLAEFERSTTRSQPSAAGDQKTEIDRMISAVELYRGPFLDGLSLGDSPAFQEWMLLKGEEIQRRMVALLDRLTILQMRAGETGQGAHWARRQLELEPYREQAHRQLMRALALDGERSAALAHYEICRRLLAEELGCEPEDETQALYAQIRDNSLPGPLSASLVPAASTQPASTRAGAGPGAHFVARQEELAKLGSLLEQALSGRGGVVLISGEPGSGKTALMDEFSRQAGQAHPDLIALRGRCNAHGALGDPCLPFREILQTLAGDIESKRAGGMLSPEQARRVWETLPAVCAALVEHGSDLVGRFLPGEALLQRLESFSIPASAGRWRKRLREIAARSPDSVSSSQPDLFAQVTDVLRALSLQVSLLLEIDDLQWADSGTLALLFHLGRRLAGSRILLVVAYRPLEYGAGQDSQAAGLGMETVLRELRREWGDIWIDLEQADGQTFIEALIDSEPNRLGAGFRRKLYDHTGGNPLFTVELLHSFESQGMLAKDEAGYWVEAPGLNWDYCPPQVEAVIAGHLAALPDEDLELLQAAAVQGEQFAAEVAARVLGQGEEAVLQRLGGPLRRRHRLVEAVSLERLAASGKRLSHYRFRHALLQRGAYNSLDAIRQPQLHEATGQALEIMYAEEGEKPHSLAPALAWHYEAAGLNLAAARALHMAGRQALRLSAYLEALNLFNRGLVLLAAAPPSPERSEIEQLVRVDRLIPVRSLEGSGSQELAGALAAALEAGAGEAQDHTRLITLQAEEDHLISTGQFEAAVKVAEQVIELARPLGDEAFMSHAHFWMGFAYNLQGRLQESDDHFNWVLAHQALGHWAEHRAAVGYDVTVTMLTFSALNHWFLGHPEIALRYSTQAVTSALQLGDLYGQAVSTSVGSMTLFLLRSDAASLHERGQLCRRVCAESGFAWWQYFAEVILGWLAVKEGQAGASIERMQAAIAAWNSTGMVVGSDALAVVLADSCLIAARLHPVGDLIRPELLAIGLGAIEPLLGPEVPCGQSYQPELHRLKGELLIEREGLAAADEALECFQQSLQLGQEMGALAWQLRSARSLLCLRLRQGEAYAAELAEARCLLRELYARFTEGFDFLDLQEAAALIGEAG